MTDQELAARFDKFEASVKSELSFFRSEMTSFRSEMTSFRSEMTSFKSEVRSEIKAEGEITRRHFDVVAEGLRADIKVIADGHIALRDDVAELKAGQERLEVGQERLEDRVLALEHRQGKLEEGQNALVTEVRLLAARLPA